MLSPEDGSLTQSNDLREVRVLATCALGLGFSYSAFQAGLALDPHAIACDAGSSDFGPYFLGTGQVQKSRSSLKRDLGILLAGARKINVPFLTGSAGGAGSASQVDEMMGLVREIAREQSLSFKAASIRADVDKDWLLGKLRDGAVNSVGAATPLSEEAIRNSSSIVAMMGAEPFISALDGGADVIIAGRATDPSIFASFPLREGIPADVAWHAAKSIDKGYLATTQPQLGSPVLGRMAQDHFVLEPTDEVSRCTVASVASLTLYENPNPFEVAQPTGVINTFDAKYEQLDPRRVKVSGSRYPASQPPTLKIEGAQLMGHRVILIAGIRDPRVISRLDDYLDAFRVMVSRSAKSIGIAEDSYSLQFRIYGRDAILGASEPMRNSPSHEIGLICDVVGATEDIAATIGSRLGPMGSRLDITGKLGGGGNFAYPFSPSLIKVGPVFNWSIWHIVDTSEQEMRAMFNVNYEDIRN